jgi:hypothetical protein
MSSDLATVNLPLDKLGVNIYPSTPRSFIF